MTLRISDAERDTAAGELSGHFAAGRLDHDEFQERLAAAYAAKTGADLAPLFADLPVPPPPAAAAPMVWAQPAPSQRSPFLPLLVLVLVLTGVGSIAHGSPLFFLFLVVAALIWRASRQRRHRGDRDASGPAGSARGPARPSSPWDTPPPRR